MSEVTRTSTSTPHQQAAAWLHGFGGALSRCDIDAVVAMLGDEVYWRDLLAFTWNICTQEGRSAIRAMLEARLAPTAPRQWQLDGDASEDKGVVEAAFTFETAVGRGQGYLRLKDGKAWTLLTALTELKGFEERKGASRPLGAEHGAEPGRKSWIDKRAAQEAALGTSEQPHVLIIGGGQGGIVLGARLRRLGVPTLIVEKHARPGDSWRRRYNNLCLHDPVWYDHLPYLPFPDDWPVFMPKDKLGDWLEMYTRVMELHYWGGTVARSARFDDARQEWEVVVERDGKNVTLRPRQLVFALGVSGYPVVPEIPGADTFQGTQQHSSQYIEGAAWRGKPCVVLGSNNSAHDICADLWESGARVTMVQRSSTLVARSDTLTAVGLRSLYSEAAVSRGITTDRADMVFASLPHRLLPALQTPLYEEMARRDAGFYARLRAKGFMLDFGADGSGLYMKYLRRGSGYYIDVGASDLVADGSIGLRSGVSIARIGPRSVHLTDGSELPADLIVYATGYGSMSHWLSDLVSPEVARQVGPVWGLGSATPGDPGPWEGELRNMWKPTQVAQLWIHGGNLQQSRYYSQFLALQIKARMEGLATEVYRQPQASSA